MQAEQTDTGTEITDKAIAQYLNCNPDFFVNNQDILSRLRIPHDSGKAVSLIEKQVGVLRSKSRHLENSLLDLIAVARQNENLHDRLHTLIQEIITAPTLSDIVALTQTSLRDNFSAEDVHILLIAAAPKRASRKKAGNNPDNKSASGKIIQKQPDCKSGGGRGRDRGALFRPADQAFRQSVCSQANRLWHA